MGGLVQDHLVPSFLEDLNLRFSPGDSIKEMAKLQAEFEIFSEKHSLKESFGLLNVGPLENWAQRRGWNRYLDSLKKLPSDQPGQSAHDRIVAVLQRNLESKDPRPVHFIPHVIAARTPGLLVRPDEQPLVFSSQSYLTISLPMKVVEKDRGKRRAGR
jgi:hypothetical protein